MEGPVRLELTTPCLKGRCSNQLSYGPSSARDTALSQAADKTSLLGNYGQLSKLLPLSFPNSRFLLGLENWLG